MRDGDFANPWYPDASHLWPTYDLFVLWCRFLAWNCETRRRPRPVSGKWLSRKCST